MDYKKNIRFDTVAFYILKIFWYHKRSATNDDEWTPKEHSIGLQKYNQKLQNLSQVLQIGSAEYKFPFIGSEVRIEAFLKD
jgi:hypothetical protein